MLIFADGLGSPEVNFDSFWHVYKQLRDAVDMDCWATMDGSAASDGENMSDGEGANANALPLNHLRPCVLGENGVPAGTSEYSDGEAGMPLFPPQRIIRPQAHTLIQNLLWQWNSQMMKVTRSTESVLSNLVNVMLDCI